MRIPRDEELLGIFRTTAMPMAFSNAEAIEYANERFAETLGYASTDDVIGLDPVDDIVHEGARSDLREAFGQWLRGDVAFEGLRCLAIRKDGSDFPAFFRAHGYDTCEGRRVFFTLVDDTEDHRQRGILDLLHRAVDSVQDALFVVHLDGRIVYANRSGEGLLEAEPGGLAEHGAREFVVDRESAALARYAEALLETGQATVELELRTLGGRVFPGHMSTSHFEDPETGETLAMAVIRDLTDERAVAAEREHREQQLAVTLSEAHHRIKNTLQVATDMLTLQVLASDVDAVRTALQRAATRIRALSAVHDGMSAGEDVKTVALRPLVETVVNGLRESPALTSEPVAVTAEVDDIRVTSRQASAVALIATELVTNAMAHSDSERVSVEFRAEEGAARLSVTDWGCVDVPPEAIVEGRRLGIQLVELLSQEQLNGSFEIGRAAGRTEATVRFPLYDNE